MGPIHPVWALAAIHPRWGNMYTQSVEATIAGGVSFSSSTHSTHGSGHSPSRALLALSSACPPKLGEKRSLVHQGK